MMNRSITILLSIAGLIYFVSSAALAAESGTVQGYVRDVQTHEPLPGANVLILGTTMGASTGLNGNFVIPTVPSGSYMIRATYVGYETKEMSLNVKSNATVTINFYLEAVGVKGKEVVVTAQASGQSAAINQQLASNQIVSVVSAARIQELPDANAAESVEGYPVFPFSEAEAKDTR